ncbi:MAG: hypothetical protein SWX82_21960 [Cyanobacteriota bacterium]|nr:hypothetical protein [Cyanobacteriota bacterium]
MKKEEGRRKKEVGWVKRISQPNKSEKNEEGRRKKEEGRRLG